MPEKHTKPSSPVMQLQSFGVSLGPQDCRRSRVVQSIDAGSTPQKWVYGYRVQGPICFWYLELGRESPPKGLGV